MGTDGVWDVLSNEEVVGIVLASQAHGVLMYLCESVLYAPAHA
jgi:hypothetical protein